MAAEGQGGAKAAAPAVARPDYAPSGKLNAQAVNGVSLKYNEPVEAKMPQEEWRLYVFKGDTIVGEPYRVHRQTAYLFGRERRVVDIPLDHPSCSSQHAVLQHRLTDKGQGPRVRPYLIDLGSTNGTYLNGELVEPKRYVELLEKDVVKFGYSSREYVLLKARGDKPQDAA